MVLVVRCSAPRLFLELLAVDLAGLCVEARLGQLALEVLLHLGCQHALIIHGEDGIDECSLGAPTRICEVRRGQELREYTITPEEVGLTRISNRAAIQGGDPAFNASLLKEILNGQLNGAASDMLCLNTGAALLASAQVDSLGEGVKLARATLQEGKARRKLEDVVACSHALAR